MYGQRPIRRFSHALDQPPVSTPVSRVIILAALALLFSPATRFVHAQQERPNIVILFADDLGWSDVSYEGGDVPTPHIDALARAGTRFTAAYAPCATCSPSRATLLTGRHPARLALTRHIPGGRAGQPHTPFNQWKTDPGHEPSRNWLPLNDLTYAEVLRDHGYRTGFVGKWHLGYKPYHPIHQGFDEQYGVSNYGHPHSYFAPFWENSDTYADTKKGRYLTERITESAVHFIDEQSRDRPFHLSLFYYTVHGPIQGKPELVAKYRQKGLSKEKANYAAMLESLDASVGRVEQALKDRDLFENTLLIFAGDQGGRFENKPFRGGKLKETVYEGGSRIPFFVTWPGHVQPGREVRRPVMTTDVMPTLADLVDAPMNELPYLDGVSLLDALLDGEQPPARSIFLYRSYVNENQALRDGKWKLVATREGTYKLYDLDSDPGEQHDLADQKPAQARALYHQLQAWKAEMGVPRTAPPAPKRANASAQE